VYVCVCFSVRDIHLLVPHQLISVSHSILCTQSSQVYTQAGQMYTQSGQVYTQAGQVSNCTLNQVKFPTVYSSRPTHNASPAHVTLHLLKTSKNITFVDVTAYSCESCYMLAQLIPTLRTVFLTPPSSSFPVGSPHQPPLPHQQQPQHHQQQQLLSQGNGSSKPGFAGFEPQRRMLLLEFDKLANVSANIWGLKTGNRFGQNIAACVGN
jgi:hypothetical protein